MLYDDGDVIINPAVIAKILRGMLMSGDGGEIGKACFWNIGLNAKSNVSYIDSIVSDGKDIGIRMKEAYKAAVLRGASKLITAQYRPKAEAGLSRDELAEVRKFMFSGMILGINVIDHLIIADRCFSSLSGNFRRQKF